MKRREPTIVIDLFERLGNQLFQYAAARQLEMEGAHVVFSDRTQGTLPMMETFVGRSVPLASRRQELLTGYLPPLITEQPHLNVLLRQPLVVPTLHRRRTPLPFAPRPETLPARGLFRLRAYFQHYSWFAQSLAVVLEEIESSIHEVRIGCPTFDVCVNLRRGDYVALGWDLSFEYYAKSLKLVAENAGDNVVVNSDDRLVETVFSEYLRAQGFNARPASSIECRQADTHGAVASSVMRDFCLIANARNLIMSNSTFCWWAAALGDSIAGGGAERIVIYPQGWVGKLGDEDGLVRDTWTTVGTGRVPVA